MGVTEIVIEMEPASGPKPRGSLADAVRLKRECVPCGWPVVTVSRPAAPDPSRELVVAAYREDLSWLAEVPYRVTVYQKEGRRLDGVDAVYLPNGKREAGAYLEHVVRRYDSLAPMTVFCQGHPFDHSPDFLARLSLPYDRPTTLTTRYLEHSPAPHVKALDLVGRHHGYEVRYGDASVQAHPGVPAWFNPAAWDHVFAVPMPRPLWFGYGATWAVPAAAIRARPRSFWARLLDECDPGDSGRSWTDPPLNPWTLEALWRYIFAGPAEFPARFDS